MSIATIKKKYPILDEKDRPSTYPTFGSQVFGDDGESRALWQDGKGFCADDSEKLGGKDPAFYIQPRNLLDNSWFGGTLVDGVKNDMVAQAGFNAVHGTTLYLADRWKCYMDSELTPADGYITITKGSMWQRVKGLDATKTYTFAVMGMDGNIRIMTGSPFVEYVSGTNWGIVEGDGIPCFQVDTGSWVWAALYEGEYTADNLPPYVPKGYGVEMMECMRYLRRIDGDPALFGYTASNSMNVYFVFNEFEQMINPDEEARLTGGDVGVVCEGEYYAGTISESLVTRATKRLVITYDSSQPSAKSACVVWASDPIFISKEL